MRKFYVYVHVLPNGKRYVGVTTKIKPELRWAEGKGYWYNKHFSKAILKYGWDNITHEVFEVESEEEMYRKEVELISFYHSNDPRYGYNHSSGGESGGLGCTRSKETRKKLSEAHKGKLHSEETKRKMSEAKKGKPCKPRSEEYRRHLSKALKGKPLNEEHRKRIAENNRRKAKDPEFRKKLSEACKNKPRVKIKLPDGTIIETTKNLIVRNYVNKNKAFEYVS